MVWLGRGLHPRSSDRSDLIYLFECNHTKQNKTILTLLLVYVCLCCHSHSFVILCGLCEWKQIRTGIQLEGNGWDPTNCIVGHLCLKFTFTMCYFFVCIFVPCLAWPMFSMSLDCPFLAGPLTFIFLILAWSMVKLAWSKLFFHFHAQDYILPVYIIHGVAKTYPPIQDRGNVLSNACTSSIFVLLHVVRLSIHVTCSTQYKTKNILIVKVFGHVSICWTDDETNQYFVFAILNILRFGPIKLA